MKKIINKITLVILTISMIGCSEPDNAIYNVFDDVTYGAVLRTTASISTTFDVANFSSEFSIEIEEQDEEYGDLLSEVKVYVKADTGSEVLLNTIAASDFANGPMNLPRYTLTVTLQEAIDALGIPAANVNCGGVMTFRLELHLTDGRVFSANNASGSVSGSYFNSPFLYTVGIVANLPSDTLYTGLYDLTTSANGVFGTPDYVAGIYTIEAISNTERKIVQVTTLPAFGGFGPVDVKFNFVCGEIVLVAKQSLGASCGPPLTSGPADVNALYDINAPDDSDFIVNYTSDEGGSCGSASQQSFRLVKQ